VIKYGEWLAETLRDQLLGQLRAAALDQAGAGRSMPEATTASAIHTAA
jgi:hypothetical protein